LTRLSSLALASLWRAFDLFCALTGIAALVFLGPWMLLSAATSHIPEAGELVRLEGTVLTCHETRQGGLLVLTGRASAFLSQPGSCTEVFAMPDAGPAKVSIYAVPASLMSTRVPVASYGLSVDDKVVRIPQSDLRAARVDRILRYVLGSIGTLTLACLIVMITRTRDGLRRLLLRLPTSRDS
jgi:hypothetical protein